MNINDAMGVVHTIMIRTGFSEEKDTDMDEMQQQITVIYGSILRRAVSTNVLDKKIWGIQNSKRPAIQKLSKQGEMWLLKFKSRDVARGQKEVDLYRPQ